MTDQAEERDAAEGWDTTEGSGVEPAIAEVEAQLRALTASVRASMRDAAKRIDPSLSLFGLKLLQLLKRAGPTHPGTAAELLMVDKSVISRNSRQLQELGLVELLNDPNDGRSRLLTLTPSAARRVEKFQTGIMLEYDILRSWTVADLRSFAGYLARLSTAKGALRPDK